MPTVVTTYNLSRNNKQIYFLMNHLDVDNLRGFFVDCHNFFHKCTGKETKLFTTEYLELNSIQSKLIPVM